MLPSVGLGVAFVGLISILVGTTLQGKLRGILIYLGAFMIAGGVAFMLIRTFQFPV